MNQHYHAIVWIDHHEARVFHFSANDVERLANGGAGGDDVLDVAAHQDLGREPRLREESVIAADAVIGVSARLLGAAEVVDESAAHAGHAGSDGTGSGTHFRVRIASPAFAGKVRVAQHRLVYDALDEFIARGLHALAIEIAN